MRIRQGHKSEARDIARLIMKAMSYECCQYYIGEEHSLEEFEDMMTELVSLELSQYSYKNTSVAVSDNDEVIGICVSYDGAMLHTLRQSFVEATMRLFGQDHSGIQDETQPGELYIDSLAVDERYRGQGVATDLLRHATSKALQMNIPAVGLLVDKANPRAERLYTRVGFCYVNDSEWGGHAMKHLQKRTNE